MEGTGTGKWRQAGVPHKGWTCVNIIDNGEPEFVCEMCEVMHIRYIHVMEHAAHPPLACGCICAGHMEEDVHGARKRESGFKSRQLRRKNWLSRRWQHSARGNDFLNVRGYNVVVFPSGFGGYCGRLTRRDGVGGSRFVAAHPSPEAAKLAAFDELERLKEAEHV